MAETLAGVRRLNENSPAEIAREWKPVVEAARETFDGLSA